MEIFVYGTLMQGLQRASALQGSRFLGEGTIQASLYDLGSYPGIAEGSDRVSGEVYEIDDATLQVLDAIEGYDKDEPESSLYYRKQVTAIMNNNAPQQVETYYYSLSIKNGLLIKAGDYRMYIEAQH